MTGTPAPPEEITETFRAWVQDGLAMTGRSASALARDLGLGKNMITQFLSGRSRSITLGDAQAIACALRADAADKGLALAPFRGRFDG